MKTHKDSCTAADCIEADHYRHTPTPMKSEFTCSDTDDLSGICELCGNGLDQHDRDFKCSEVKRTPTPWSLLPARTLVNIKGPRGEQIGQLEINSPNARFIVRAVNSHDELLAAAKEMFAVLMKKPGSKLWPDEEELNRSVIGWNRRISKAEARS